MLGSIVPTVISNALSIALYAMFIAIIIPGMKKDVYKRQAMVGINEQEIEILMAERGK